MISWIQATTAADPSESPSSSASRDRHPHVLDEPPASSLTTSAEPDSDTNPVTREAARRAEARVKYWKAFGLAAYLAHTEHCGIPPLLR